MQPIEQLDYLQVNAANATEVVVVGVPQAGVLLVGQYIWLQRSQPSGMDLKLVPNN